MLQNYLSGWKRLKNLPHWLGTFALRKNWLLNSVILFAVGFGCGAVVIGCLGKPIGERSVTITWTDQQTNNITQYRIYTSTNATVWLKDWPLLVTALPNARNIRVTVSGTSQRWFVITAKDAENESNFSDIAFLPALRRYRSPRDSE
jgi:hypothetical protein